MNAEQRLLITRRANHQSYPGLWEFPGGKVEADESVEMALSREMLEEVGVNVVASRFLGEVVTHEAIVLHVFLIEHWQGQAACLESQLDLRWVSLDELADYAFPKANQAIIDRLKVSIHATRC